MRKIFFLFAALLLSLTLVIAEPFNFDSSNIVDSYSTQDAIRGTINISFIEASPYSNITTNFLGRITLLDLLKANKFLPIKNYSCTTSDCLPDFKALKAATAFQIPENESKIIGFKLTGKEVEVQDVKFTISSNAQASCFRQLAIEPLNKKDKLILGNKYSDITCFEKNYGCFSPSLEQESYQQAILPKSPNKYCENITLPPAPAYKLGSKITNGSGGDITLELYSSSGILLKSCVLPKHSSSEEELDCIVNYPSFEQKDYFVCIKASGDNIGYKIRTESSGDKCGNNAAASGSSIDYELSAISMQFAPFGFFTINQTTYETTNLGLRIKDYLNDYIQTKYKGNCEPQCIIPFAIDPLGLSQSLSVSDALITYKSQGTILEANTLFFTDIFSPTINSSFLQIDVSLANFTIPSSTSANKLEFFLDSDKILSKNVSISKVNIELSPRFALIGQDTIFIAATSGNISSYYWTFGDGATASTKQNSSSHRYTSAGEFNLQVQIVKSSNITESKTFRIVVGDAKTSANTTISSYEKRLVSLSSSINALPSWISKEISRQINLAELNISLKTLKKDFSLASNDSEYARIMSELIKLDVPSSISISKTGSLPIKVGFNNINSGFVASLSGQKDTDESALEKSIVSWNTERYSSALSFNVYSKFSDAGVAPLLTKFKIDLNPKSSITDEYLFIGFPSDSITFLTAYNQKAVSAGAAEGTTIPLSSNTKSIEFAIKDSVEASSLGAYVSPVVNRLGITSLIEACNFNNVCQPEIDEDSSSCPSDCKAPRIPWLWLILILVLAFVVYVFLQEWYKKSYEKYLFKNQNELYNLISFINNSRKAGMKDAQIKEKLIKAGWKKEQVDYAFRKIDGRRTGMYEIPLFKFRENKKVKEELTKRGQQRPQPPQFSGAARFIKR